MQTLRPTETERPAVTPRTYEQAIWSRDGRHCRWCDRRVHPATSRRVPHGIVYRLARHVAELEWDVRGALLLCAACHARVTGQVTDLWRVVGTQHFLCNGRRVIDATARVAFELA